MKKSILIVGTVVTLIVLLVGTSVVMAAKPPNNGAGKNVIELSNGFPSGSHFNLNIHGKNDSYTCDSISGGASVFIDEYGEAKLQLLINKKSNLTELTVLEGCAINGGTATVQLPWKINVDGQNINSDGYYLYARIRAKPQNGKTQDDEPQPSLITVSSYRVIEACANPLEDNTCDGTLLLGYTDMNAAYLPGDQEFIRWEDPTAKGKDKNSKGVNITPLLQWTGWIVDEVQFDIGTNDSGTCTYSTGDGRIDQCDVPPGAAFDVDIPLSYDDGDGIVEIEEWLIYKADQYQADPETAPYCVYYDNDWIWNVDELVLAEQDITNDGTKLLQLRFYPVRTTTFTEKGHIIVEKVSEDDTVQSFDFTVNDITGTPISDLFSLKHNGVQIVGESPDPELEAGTYEVIEAVPSGWPQPVVTIEKDTTGGSYADPVQKNRAVIDLAEGETVIVRFTNELGEIEILKKDEGGNIITLAGPPWATFTVDPNPYGSGTLTVEDNDINDANPNNGVILLKSILLGNYQVTETQAPTGYVVDPTSKTADVNSSGTVSLSFTNSLLP